MTLSTTVVGSGSIVRTPDAESYPCGATVTLEAIPAKIDALLLEILDAARR